MNVKPGDLAISVKAELASNAGLIVQVLHRHVDDETWDFKGELTWWCRCAQPMSWYFIKSGKTVQALEGPVPDVCLRPIRPGNRPPAARGRRMTPEQEVTA